MSVKELTYIISSTSRSDLSRLAAGDVPPTIGDDGLGAGGGPSFGEDGRRTTVELQYGGFCGKIFGINALLAKCSEHTYEASATIG